MILVFEHIGKIVRVYYTMDRRTFLGAGGATERGIWCFIPASNKNRVSLGDTLEHAIENSGVLEQVQMAENKGDLPQ